MTELNEDSPSKSSKVLTTTATYTPNTNTNTNNTSYNRTRLFPKTVPSMQINVSNTNKISQPQEQNSKDKKSPTTEQQQSQRRSQSVSDLDMDNTNEPSSSTSTCNSEEKSLKTTPKFPLLTNNSSNTTTNNIQNSNQKSTFERMSASRSSASNLLQNRDLSFNSSNQNLRSSFNTHQALKSNTGTSNESTVEYASFNIKPSQYKQTGIFLPINNNSTSLNNGSSTNLNTKKQGISLNAKKQANLIRLIKEDLEILIQRLRNLQKNRHWSFTSLVDTNAPFSLNSSSTNMEQFKSLAEDFNEKIGQQLNLITLMSNDAESSNNNNTHEIQEYHLQLRQLHNVIKQNCSSLNSGTDSTTNGTENGCSVNTNNNIETVNSPDNHLSNLSKSLNEFMQNLDKLNSFYSSVALK